MKHILLFSIIFCAIALPALGELTDADLNQIRLIVTDSENSLKEYTQNEITTSENRMKGHIDDKIEGVRSSISALKWVIGILMGVIAILIAAIGIPLSLMARQSPKDNNQQIEEFTKKLIMQLARDQMTELMTELVTELVTELKRDQEQKIESLTQEIETLKQHS